MSPAQGRILQQSLPVSPEGRMLKEEADANWVKTSREGEDRTRVTVIKVCLTPGVPQDAFM